MTEALFQYYGLDWAAMIIGLTGFYMLTKQKSHGFILQAAANVMGLAVAMWSNQLGFVVYNMILFLFASYGYMSWQRQQQLSPARVSTRR
jgi:nicotinamide riboside transporter PnuC